MLFDRWGVGSGWKVTSLQLPRLPAAVRELSTCPNIALLTVRLNAYRSVGRRSGWKVTSLQLPRLPAAVRELSTCPIIALLTVRLEFTRTVQTCGVGLRWCV